MRFFFSLILFALFLSGCAQGTAGLTIPANQTFVLGEYRTTGYRASVRNTGSQDVAAVLLDRKTGAVVFRLAVEQGRSQSVKVPARQVLHLVNSGSAAAELVVKSPVSGNEGMGFLTPDDTPTSNPRTRIEPPAPATEVDEQKSTIFKFTLEPGQSLVVGEGSSGDFNATLINHGAGLDVSGRSKESGVQTQGFGIGKAGKMDMYIRPQEVLYLVNNSAKRSTVKVKTDRPVQGGRVVNR